MITKEFLAQAKKKFKIKEVKIDGQQAFVRSMTAGDKISCDYLLSQDVLKLRSAVLVRSICDAEGNRLFKDEDTSLFDDLPSELIDEAFEAAYDLSGFPRRVQDEQAKN